MGSEIIFWTALALVLYVYVGYPIFVYVLSRLFPKKVGRSALEPHVSIIITAYNEERHIREKLFNTLAIDYPTEKLEIIVASDCSSDGTDTIVREFASQGVKLVRQAKRRGKTAAQNLAVENAAGEILLFSDATSVYGPNVLKELLPNFADPSVGCVAGRLVYTDGTGSDVGRGAKKYWNYETFLKESESRISSLVGVSGCIYAVRKSPYVPMYEDACSDFLICTLLYRQGLRTVFEPNAVCLEETNSRSAQEFKMRVRVISQTYSDLWVNRDMLNPAKSGFYGIQLISHKLLRYAVPLFLLLIFLSTAVLAFSSTFYAVVFGLQILFYLSALAAWNVERNFFRLGIFAMPMYFVLANLASAIGFYKFLQGERYAKWEPIRSARDTVKAVSE